MTADVLAVRGDTSFKDMAAMISGSRISAMPVVDDAGKVIGVVSEADLLVKEVDQAAHPGLFAGLRRRRDREKAAGITAADLMTTPPVMIRPDEPVQRAALLMYDHGVKRLPVVDDTGHLTGIISRADVLSVFSRPDEEIRREVADQLILHHFLVDPARFTVSVQDGIVTLAGRPETDEVGRRIIDAVRRVAGVVAVRDHLLYSDSRRPTATAGADGTTTGTR
jgi:CBS-domain-containing membrane protein